MAIAAIEGEGLGEDIHTDLLVIVFLRQIMWDQFGTDSKEIQILI